MKIFHTSDWHFGRTLLGADLTAAFEQWADFLVQTVREREIDAVLISGDVYDRGIPPVAMVDLLSDTLARLSQTTRVVLTSGNHDSAKRLGFGSALMRPELTIRTDSRTSNTPVILPDRHGNIGAIVYPIPYLDPDVERKRLAPDLQELPLGEEESSALSHDTSVLSHKDSQLTQESSALSHEPARLERSHQAVIGEVMRRIRADILGGQYGISCAAAPLGQVPRIVMAHAFVTGGEASESEQDIHVGGVDCVPSSIFDIRSDTGASLIDYVALGHLHGAQSVNREGQPIMRYSGSPVAFSFSEEQHVKSGVLVEFEPRKSSPHIELIQAPIYRRLATLRDSFEKLRSSEYREYKDMFVRAYVTDPSRPRDLVARLRKVFPYLLQTRHATPTAISTAQELHALKNDPLGTLREFFVDNGGRALTEEETRLLERLWSKRSSSTEVALEENAALRSEGTTEQE